MFDNDEIREIAEDKKIEILIGEFDIRVPTGTSDMISPNAIDDIERDYPNIKITIGEF